MEFRANPGGSQMRPKGRNEIGQMLYRLIPISFPVSHRLATVTHTDSKCAGTGAIPMSPSRRNSRRCSNSVGSVCTSAYANTSIQIRNYRQCYKVKRNTRITQPCNKRHLCQALPSPQQGERAKQDTLSPSPFPFPVHAPHSIHRSCRAWPQASSEQKG